MSDVYNENVGAAMQEIRSTEEYNDSDGDVSEQSHIMP